MDDDTPDLRDRAVAIYDRFTHDHRDRRTLLREMTLLTGSALAAEALIGGIAASPAAAAIVAADDRRLKTFPAAQIPVAGGKPLKGYVATPRGKRPRDGAGVSRESRIDRLVVASSHAEPGVKLARNQCFCGIHATCQDAFRCEIVQRTKCTRLT